MALEHLLFLNLSLSLVNKKIAFNFVVVFVAETTTIFFFNRGYKFCSAWFSGINCLNGPTLNRSHVDKQKNSFQLCCCFCCCSDNNHRFSKPWLKILQSLVRRHQLSQRPYTESLTR
ncbi:hypothetical protein ACOME3_005753 [Neoechinorhynchus agilis]